MADFNPQNACQNMQNPMWNYDLSADPQFLSSLLRWNNGYLANVLNVFAQQSSIQDFIKGETTQVQAHNFTQKPRASSKNTQNSTECPEKLSIKETDLKSNIERYKLIKCPKECLQFKHHLIKSK